MSSNDLGVVLTSAALAVPSGCRMEAAAGGAESSGPASAAAGVRHGERLREGRPGGLAAARRRDPSWQQPRRQREGRIRAEAAELVGALRRRGASTAAAAELLGVPARTLRSWTQHRREGHLGARALGRPHVHCGPAEGDAVVHFLQQHGPWVGVPTLQGAFPEAPRAELRELLGLYRQLWSAAHPRERRVLCWQRPGSVWGIDFTKVAAAIDERYPYVLAVRDLASGQQLLWRAVADMTWTTAWSELEWLLLVYGAPLVLKSDNGSAFRAGAWQRKLAQWGVWSLYSPPGLPSYNGAIEASIGSLKKRTAHQAERGGHGVMWRESDLERARELSNEVSRLHGPRGATAAELWGSRRVVTVSERERFGEQVREREGAARGAAGIALELELGDYEQAALHRGVLSEVLQESGLLTIMRRRLPQRFYGRKMAIIT